MMGAPAQKGVVLSLKRHLFPHGSSVKIQAQGLLDSVFDAAQLEYFFQLLSSALKWHFPKRHATLSESVADTL